MKIKQGREFRGNDQNNDIHDRNIVILPTHIRACIHRTMITDYTAYYINGSGVVGSERTDRSVWAKIVIVVVKVVNCRSQLSLW